VTSRPDAAQIHAEAAAPFELEAQRLLPSDTEIIDAHTHLGTDEDGRSLDLQQLLSLLDQASAARACVFPLNDPQRVPAYRAPNDAVLRAAAESDRRLVPFCRLDPAEEPVKEAERCLAAGAKGIKLHPREQAFTLEGQEINAIFKLAEDAKVPVLIHAGRGLPPIADGLVDLALKHPDATLILAHAAICDQGIITARLKDHLRIIYDTSCFFPIDVIQLLSRVPPERLVFASDPPYGLPVAGLYLALRVASQAGFDSWARRAVLGHTIAGLLEDGELPELSPPRRGRHLTLSGRLARIYTYVSVAGPAMLSGSTQQAIAMLELAVSACRDPRPGADEEALEIIGKALEAVSALLQRTDAEKSSLRLAFDLLHRSLVHAATEVTDAEMLEAEIEAEELPASVQAAFEANR
jgi:predicted TIM-barrel fold metal-dependent hydrolase